MSHMYIPNQAHPRQLRQSQEFAALSRLVTPADAKPHPPSYHSIISCTVERPGPTRACMWSYVPPQRSELTVGLQLARFTAAAACLVDGLDEEHVARAALQAVHRVVVLLDVGHDHPAVCRVVQTWNPGRNGEDV